MTDYIPSEKGVPIRMPSVANLMIDSADRNDSIYPNPYDFQITKSYSILNGFFTRIATTEVVLEWCQNNISNDASNNVIVFDISGPLVRANYTITLLDGIYTIEDCLDAIVAQLNALTPTTGVDFTINTAGNGGVEIDASGGEFGVEDSNLVSQLDFQAPSPSLYPLAFIACPDLRPYRYIDFVSSQLTYCQDVKDAATSTQNRDVLCRWYFDWDTPPQLDAYGFPILMGYTRFCCRRIYNPPKQIKWENNLPVGNLAFQVYSDKGVILPIPTAGVAGAADKNEWLMTLQVSEV